MLKRGRGLNFEEDKIYLINKDKAVALAQIFILVVGIIAIGYFIGNEIRLVSAADASSGKTGKAVNFDLDVTMGNNGPLGPVAPTAANTPTTQAKQNIIQSAAQQIGSSCNVVGIGSGTCQSTSSCTGESYPSKAGSVSGCEKLEESVKCCVPNSAGGAPDIKEQPVAALTGICGNGVVTDAAGKQVSNGKCSSDAECLNCPDNKKGCFNGECMNAGERAQADYGITALWALGAGAAVFGSKYASESDKGMWEGRSNEQ